jgi:hypothetical protein
MRLKLIVNCNMINEEEIKDEDFVIIITSQKLEEETNSVIGTKATMKDLVLRLISHIRRDLRSVEGVLYIIGTVFGFIGFLLGIIHANKIIHDESKVEIEFVLISLFLMLNFSLKIYFMWPRALARVIVIIFSLGWALAFVTYTELYFQIMIKK